MTISVLDALHASEAADASELPCRANDAELWFAESPADVELAKALCRSCPVRAECLAEALDNEIEWGVWGGLTERERRALLRKRPNVTSWRQLLETAKSEHEELAGAVETA